VSRKVLVLVGSPRPGGNTDDCARYLAERLRSVGDHSVELAPLRELTIKPCAGCRACMQRGECAIRDDDMPALMDRVAGCDVLVQAAPVYWCGPPGPVKDFVDRTHGVFTIPGYLAGKKGAIVSVAAESGFGPHEAILSSWFRYYGGEILAKVRLLAREKGELLSRPAELKKLDRLAQRMAGG